MHPQSRLLCGVALPGGFQKSIAFDLFYDLCMIFHQNGYDLLSNRVHCRTHDWRRGHARDLQRGGARLWEILQAGDWKSPAFLSYLDEPVRSRVRRGSA